MDTLYVLIVVALLSNGETFVADLSLPTTLERCTQAHDIAYKRLEPAAQKDGISRYTLECVPLNPRATI